MAKRAPPGVDLRKRLNKTSPGTWDASLGDVIYDLIAQLNDQKVRFNNLLAHMDAGNVTGLGNANAATYGSTTTVLTPEQR